MPCRGGDYLDADSGGKLDGDTSSGELLDGEATTETKLVVVPLGRRTNHGPQETSRRPGVSGGGLGLTSETTTVLSGGLVEPGLDVLLPVLAEVDVRDNVVVLDRHG